MAKYSTDIKLSGAYVLDEEAINELWSTAKEFLGTEPEVNVSLADDINLASTDPKDLFSDILTRSKLIQRILINGYGNGRRLRIRLQGEEFFSPVSMSLSGEKDATIKTRSLLVELLNAHSMAYSWVVSRWKAVTLTVLFVASFIAILVLTPYLPGPSTPQFILGVLGGGFLGFVGTGAIAAVLQKMCPPLVFRIGKSAEKLESAQRWRQTLLTVVLLGIVVSIVGGVIVEFIGPMAVRGE